MWFIFNGTKEDIFLDFMQCICSLSSFVTVDLCLPYINIKTSEVYKTTKNVTWLCGKYSPCVDHPLKFILLLLLLAEKTPRWWHRETLKLLLIIKPTRCTNFPSWSCSQAVSKPVWHIPLLRAQWKVSDDGQTNCPKHIEFCSKNKFRKISASSWFYYKNLSRCTVTWTSKSEVTVSLELKNP